MCYVSSVLPGAIAPVNIAAYLIPKLCSLVLLQYLGRLSEIVLEE
jgi:hypothetical protein